MYKFTEEHRRNISIAAKKRMSNPENNPMYRKKHSEETKKKIGLKSKGRFVGISKSEEHKRKISEAHMGKDCPWMEGENNPSWTGGGDQWFKREIMKIDKRCVLCKTIKIKPFMHLHHKDNVHSNNVRKNVILICDECHKFWHGSHL